MSPARILRPSLLAVVAMIALSLVERFGRGVGIPLGVINAAAVAFFVILMAAPVALYPLAFVRGAGPALRVFASLIPGLWWWLTEIGFRLGGRSLPEAVYLTLFLTNYAWLQILALEMVGAEIVCRFVARRRSPDTPRVFTPAVTATALAVLLAFGANVVVFPAYYRAFQTGYRDAFLVGQLPEPETFVGPLDPSTVVADPAAEKPNFVVILSDDHRADFTGYAGHPFIETPALDRLAREGMRFENMFVTSSLCSPSRASFLTGQYPHGHGVFNNFTPWTDENRTFFEYLKAAGYDTAFIGKWHMPGSLPDLRGVDTFVTFDAFGGQGTYYDCELIVDGVRTKPEKAYLAEELTDRTLAFIEEHHERPFAVYLSHKNVHSPFLPALPEQDRYAAERVELPPDAHSWTGFVDAQYVHFNPFTIEGEVRMYGEAVTSMDREIGRLLDGIDALGLADDTVVIYTSDNGYFWGEHRLIDKRWPYEESIRVPLLVRAPGVEAGSSADALVANVDLAPTLLDLAGINTPTHMQGQSFAPLLAGADGPRRDHLYYNYYFEPPFPVPTTHTLRTPRYKLVEYEGRATELYDLADDPGEQTNLIGTEQGDALRPELEARLRAVRAAAEEGRPTPPDDA